MAEEEKEDVDFEELATQYAAKIERKYNKKIAASFKETLLEQFDDLEQLQGDLEYDIPDWCESCLLDDLHSNYLGFQDESMCKKFYSVLKQMVFGEEEYEDNEALPDDINWKVTEKEIDNAQSYMHSQCPGGVFAHKKQDRSLYQLVAVGRKNDIELLSLLLDCYELSHIDNVAKKLSKTKYRKFRDESGWISECKFFTENKNPGETLIHAIREYNKRIGGGGPSELIIHPIQDDINIYIGYTMMMSKVVRKVIDSANAKKQTVCPFQLDLIICGRRQQKEDDDKENDSDDEDAEPSLASMLGLNEAQMNNELPKDGIAKMLQRGEIDFVAEEVSIDDEARSLRAINEALGSKIGNKSHKRVIVLIDRSDPDKADTVYIYQTGDEQLDETAKDYCELHMAWKTKNGLIPNYQKPDDEIHPLIGASNDFGDNSFVFSFHVHAEDVVKCDQWIKKQKSPFLPYQMCSVWPMYFHKKSKKVDDKYTAKYIYDNWGLPVKDELTMKWIQLIDPSFYEKLQRLHLKYVDL